MRTVWARFAAVAVVLVTTTAGMLTAVRPIPGALGPGAAREDPARGIVLDGLEPARAQLAEGVTGAAAGCDAYVTRTTRMCTHGPDAAPAGRDVRRDASGERLQPQEISEMPVALGSILCDGDGAGGLRVHVLYVRGSDRPDRFDAVRSALVQKSETMDGIFAESAAPTGGIRHVRFVTGHGCGLVVDNVVLPPAASGDFDRTIDELRKRGYSRRDRAYLIWMDANVYCGIGTWEPDTSPGQGNRNNYGPEYSRVDLGCWDGSTAAHEIMHNFGGLQDNSPHSTFEGHAMDGNDLMFARIVNSKGSATTSVCPDTRMRDRFDCNVDDYYHANPPPGSYLATQWNPANADWLLKSWLWSGRFHPLTPTRILDTRDGTGGHRTLVGGRQIDVQVGGAGGIPNGPVSAVVLNVTVVSPSAAGYLTAFPAAGGRPVVSSLNFEAGETVANLVVVKLGAGGNVSLFLDAGTVDVLFDTAGWFSAETGGGFGRFQPLEPARVLDTRTGTGGRGKPLGPGEALDLLVAGRGGVPADGLAGYALNVTVTRPTAGGHLRVYPYGVARPNSSNLNFGPGQTIANRVIVQPGQSGWITIYNHSGTTDVIVDVNGWFTTTETPGPPGWMTAVTPTRLLDTRIGRGDATDPHRGGARHSGPVRGGLPVEVTLGGYATVPPDASAVVLNATLVSPSATGYLTVWPSGSPRPLASDVNFNPGDVTPNLVVVKLGVGGKVSAFIDVGEAHLLFDVVGYVR